MTPQIEKLSRVERIELLGQMEAAYRRGCRFDKKLMAEVREAAGQALSEVKTMPEDITAKLVHLADVKGWTIRV